MLFVIILSAIILVLAYFVTSPGGIRGTIMAFRIGYFVSQQLWAEIESRGADITEMDIKIGVGNRWFSIDHGNGDHHVLVEAIAENICKDFKQDNLLGTAFVGREQTEFRFRCKSPMFQ